VEEGSCVWSGVLEEVLCCNCCSSRWCASGAVVPWCFVYLTLPCLALPCLALWEGRRETDVEFGACGEGAGGGDDGWMQDGCRGECGVRVSVSWEAGPGPRIQCGGELMLNRPRLGLKERGPPPPKPPSTHTVLHAPWGILARGPGQDQDRP
jgi:hypothetical protein